MYKAYFLLILSVFGVLHLQRAGDQSLQSETVIVKSQIKVRETDFGVVQKDIGEVPKSILKEEKIYIPDEKVLPIKFYSQSVNKNWEEPYQNFCEEAAFLNAYYYLTGQAPDIQEYDKDLWVIKEIEDDVLPGGYKDTSLQDTMKFANIFLENKEKISGKIIENPSVDLIKENIARGNPVFVPVYGKGMINPGFTNGGPVYHTFLIIGYDAEDFIVNEVGLTRGGSFRYSQENVMENIRNFDPQLYPDNIQESTQEILIFSKDSIKD